MAKGNNRKRRSLKETAPCVKALVHEVARALKLDQGAQVALSKAIEKQAKRAKLSIEHYVSAFKEKILNCGGFIEANANRIMTGNIQSFPVNQKAGSLTTGPASPVPNLQ